MFSIEKCSIPNGALLESYSRDGVYTDCYVTEIAGPVSHSQYVMAFYTTLIFKLERVILRWAVSRPSTDVQAKYLAEGAIDTFAAWQVENRSENQLLMSDFRGRTRSWLMVVPVVARGEVRTRLYFGSAVVPTQNSKTATSSFAFGFIALLKFHKFYSELLLYAAKSRLETQLS